MRSPVLKLRMLVPGSVIQVRHRPRGAQTGHVVGYAGSARQNQMRFRAVCTRDAAHCTRDAAHLILFRQVSCAWYEIFSTDVSYAAT